MCAQLWTRLKIKWPTQKLICYGKHTDLVIRWKSVSVWTVIDFNCFGPAPALSAVLVRGTMPLRFKCWLLVWRGFWVFHTSWTLQEYLHTVSQLFLIPYLFIHFFNFLTACVPVQLVQSIKQPKNLPQGKKIQNKGKKKEDVTCKNLHFRQCLPFFKKKSV